MPSVIKERIIFADGRHVLDRTTFTGEGDARVQSHDKYWHDGEHTYYMQLSPDTQAATQLDSPAHAFPTAAGNAFQFSTQTPDLDRYSKMDLDKAHWSDLGEERLRDLATHHLRFTAPEPREGDGAVGSVDVWLAPERGMRWVRREVTWRTPEAGGARVSIDRWTVQEFRSYGDVWMPVTVHQEQLEGSEGALRPTLASTYHAVDLRVNELVDPCSFSHIFANGVTIYGQDRILRIVGDDTHIIQASIAGGDAPRLAEP
ncbi:MAG: hypothetical protein FJX74_24050 [Armatimonadetes bacterium]|nr:hypothetical protein [Armatimonadota bacterium]